MAAHSSSTQGARAALVTGGSGFIGSHLCELLAGEGSSVIAIDDLSTGSRRNIERLERSGRVRFIEGDAGDALSRVDVNGVSEIYHLAAAVGVDLVLKRPAECIRTNIAITDRVLEFASGASRPTPVLIASSSEVYGKPSTHVFSEDDDVLYGPTTATRWSYAASKAIDEYLALAYSNEGRCPTVVARFFNTVGPRQIGRYGMVLPRFIAAALMDEPLRVFGSGNQSRCFADARDVVRALPALVRNPEAHGRVFNVGSDRTISINALAKLVTETLDSKSSIVHVPYSEAYPGGFEDLPHRKPDLSRVREATGFVAEIPLEQTIRDMAEAIRGSGVESACENGV